MIGVSRSHQNDISIEQHFPPCPPNFTLPLSNRLRRQLTCVMVCKEGFRSNNGACELIFEDTAEFDE